jgi:hypothetical protein
MSDRVRVTYDSKELFAALTVSAGGTLPTGSATEAKQDTGNTSLSAISGKLPASLGAKTGAASLPVVLSHEAGVVAGAATYAACGIGYTAYATPTDLLTITGSASKTVVVTNLVIFMQSTAAALQTIDVLKRSTANSGGTATSPTPVPHDSTSAAATGVLNLYTAAPTTGTLVGVLRTLLVSSTTLTVAPLQTGLNGILNSMPPYPLLVNDIRRPIVLHGVNEVLAINYRGAALTGGFTASWHVEWVEF